MASIAEPRGCTAPLEPQVGTAAPPLVLGGQPARGAYFRDGVSACNKREPGAGCAASLNPKTAPSQYKRGRVWGIGMALQEHTVRDRRTCRSRSTSSSDTCQ